MCISSYANSKEKKQNIISARSFFFFLFFPFWHQIHGLCTPFLQLTNTNWGSYNSIQSWLWLPELASDSIGLRDQPCRAALISGDRCKYQDPELSSHSVWLGYKVGGFYTIPLHPRPNSGKCFAYYYWFILKHATREQSGGRDARWEEVEHRASIPSPRAPPLLPPQQPDGFIFPEALCTRSFGVALWLMKSLAVHD